MDDSPKVNVEWFYPNKEDCHDWSLNIKIGMGKLTLVYTIHVPNTAYPTEWESLLNGDDIIINFEEHSTYGGMIKCKNKDVTISISRSIPLFNGRGLVFVDEKDVCTVNIPHKYIATPLRRALEDAESAGCKFAS